MRHSPLLTTSLAHLLMALIAVGAFGWICVTVAHTAFKLGPNEVLKFAKDSGFPAALSAGLAVGAVAFLGPVVIRFVLARRILIFLALTALILVDPLLAGATVIAILIAFGILRAAHSRVGASLALLLNFNDIEWPLRIIYTLGGVLIVLAMFTTTPLAMYIDALLPWPLFSVYGLIAVLSVSIVLSYITGNIYFPKLINRRWALLAHFCAMLAINPVVGLFSIIHGLFLVLSGWSASHARLSMDDNSVWSDTDLPSWQIPGEWLRLIYTAGTMESEAFGTYR